MPTTLDIEDRLRFVFDNRWHAVKWDDERPFQDGLRRMPTTQAVDILGTLDSAQLWFFEIKDPRGDWTRYRRADGAVLDSIIGDKVRDTLASVSWAIQRIAATYLHSYLRVLFVDRKERVRVVLWVEGVDAAFASIMTTKIERYLKWLKPKVIVTNRVLFDTTHPIPGLSVQSLPGAPARP